MESTRPVVVQDRFERPEENRLSGNCTYRVEAEQLRQSEIQKKSKRGTEIHQEERENIYSLLLKSN